jgi:hypothetical protein
VSNLLRQACRQRRLSFVGGAGFKGVKVFGHVLLRNREEWLTALIVRTVEHQAMQGAKDRRLVFFALRAWDSASRTGNEALSNAAARRVIRSLQASQRLRRR